MIHHEASHAHTAEHACYLPPESCKKKKVSYNSIILITSSRRVHTAAETSTLVDARWWSMIQWLCQIYYWTRCQCKRTWASLTATFQNQCLKSSVVEAQMGVRWSMINLWWLGRLNGGGLMTSVDHASELVIHVMVSRALKLSVGLNLLVLLFFVSFLTSPRVRARVRDHWWNQCTSSLQWNMHSKWDKNCTYSE